MISFEEVPSTVLVRIEGNVSTVQLPVGTWVVSLLTKDDVIGVLFGKRNLEEGVVLGAY